MVRSIFATTTLLLSPTLFFASCGGRGLDGSSKSDASVQADAQGTGRTCGRVGALCSDTEWCAFTLVGSCGVHGETGNCQDNPVVTTCPDACPGVCGCDRKAYCNSCEAHSHGTDITTEKSCFPDGKYTAYALATGAPRFVLFKADPSRNLCFRMQFVTPGQAQYSVKVTGNFQIEFIDVTNQAADCVLTSAGYPRTPSGDVLKANGAQGTADVMGGQSCQVSTNVFVRFDTRGVDWAPLSEQLLVDKMGVGGGC